MANKVTVAHAATWILLVLTALLASGYLWLARRVPHPPASPVIPAAEAPWAESVVFEDEPWGVFQNSGGTSSNAVAGSPLATRYRLAGTFFLYASDGGSTEGNRRAIVDDLQKKKQSILREGDTLDEYLVARVFPDRVILRSDGTDYELSLSYAGPALASQPMAPTNSAEPVSMEDMPALESTRFGKRVGDNRWVFQREELLKYYHDVLDEPERIAALYVSLKPDYQESEIAGYRLNAEGEADFFKAVGLQENDVIRKVNSMRMVSQRRAEYFMSEFLKDRVSALVLDVEREGKPEKLIYLIR